MLQIKKKCFVIVTVLLSGLIICGCSKSPAPKPLGEDPTAPQNPITRQDNKSVPRMVIGYYENPWPGTPDTSGSFPSMKTFYRSMSGVGPFWYKATTNGTLETRESKLVYDTAKQLGLKMYPLVTNKTGATEQVLSNPEIRTKTINNIIKIVQEKQYDGINIDFELLPPKYRTDLTMFMAELYPKMKSLNKTLIISVFPKVDVAEDVSGAYDYVELVKNADFVQIMTYDNHWATSKPGPIAPVDWYEKNVKYAIEKCGAHKVIIGVSAYGYDWPTKGEGETVKYVDALIRAQQHGVKVSYDETAQAPHFKYKDHEVWFENDRSTAAKLDIVAKYRPAGIAIWRIGQEQPEIWKIIDQKFPKQQ